MAATLELIIKGVDHVSGTFAQVDKKAGGLGQTLKSGLGMGAIAAGAGLGVAVVAGVNFVKAAIAEEEMIGRLDQALANVGVSYKEQGAAIEATIKQREKLAFSDDQLRESLALLVAQTGSVEEAFKRQQIAMDLSRGTGLDLQTASRLLGKVTDENRNVLGRYGIAVTGASNAQEVLAAVQAKFGGQSERFAETATAKWQRFGIAMDNIKETIGGLLLPVVTKLGLTLAAGLEKATPIIENVIKAISALANIFGAALTGDLQRAHSEFMKLSPSLYTLGQIMFDLGSIMRNDVIPVLEQVFEAFKQVADAILDFVGEKAAIAAALGAVAVLFGALAIAAGAAALSVIAATAPILAIAAAAAVLVGGLVVLDEKTGIVTDAFNYLSEQAALLWDWLGPKLSEVIENLTQLWNTNLYPAIVAVAGELEEHLLPVLRDVAQWMIDNPALVAGVVLAIGTLVAPWGAVVLGMLAVIAMWDKLKLKAMLIINDMVGYINTFVRAWNSVADKEFLGKKLGPHLPEQEGINIGKQIANDTPNEIPDWKTDQQRIMGGVAEPSYRMSGTGEGITVNQYFTSVVPAGPAEVQRAKLAIEQVLRS